MFPQSMEQLRRRDRRKIFEKRRKIFEKKRSKPVRTKNLKFDGFRRIFLGIRRISTDFDGFRRPGPDQIFCFRNRSGSDFFAPGTGPDQFFCFRNRFGLDFLVTEPTRCSSDAKKRSGTVSVNTGAAKTQNVRSSMVSVHPGTVSHYIEPDPIT